MKSALALSQPLLGKRYLLPILAVLAALAAALLPWQIGIGLAAALVVVPVVFRWPLAAVYLLILSVPVQTTVNLPGGLTVTQVVMGLTLAVWWAAMAVRGERKIWLPGFAVALALYITVMILSLLVTTVYSDSLAEISRWIVVLLSFIILVNTVKTRREVIGLVICFLISGFGEGVLGTVQALTGLVPPSFYVGLDLGADAASARGFGTIGMPNSYAGFLNMTLPLALALAVYLLIRAWTRLRAAADKSGSMRLALDEREVRQAAIPALVVTAGVVAMLLGLMLSYSRGGYLGFGLGILMMVVALGRRAAGVLALLAVGAAVVALMAFTGTLPGPVADRLASITNQLQIFDVRGVVPTPENWNQVERLVHWQVAGNMFLSDPWLGVGIGNFNALFNNIKFNIQGWPYSRGHAHNYFLHALAETGIIGLTFYLGLLATAIASARRALAKMRGPGHGLEQALLIGAFGVLWAIIGHSVFEDLHVLNMGIHWAAVIALFVLVPRMNENTASAHAGP